MPGPRIGLVDTGNEKIQHYLDPLVALGARTTVLDWTNCADVVHDAFAFDGLVLCGGDDLCASWWGEENHPMADLDPPERGNYEVALAREAVLEEIPLLTVCRGTQVLNVALGGTLQQHLPDDPGHGDHADGALHEIEVAAPSMLERLLEDGTRRGTVNSYHHQAVGRLAPDLRAVAWSADGVIEAVEGPGRFCLGVQWHPERPGNSPPFGRDLFAALVLAASAAAA